MAHQHARGQVFLVGDRIGAYEILRYLGGGGMGEVYVARHVHIGRKAAIKALLPELSTNEDVLSRFFTEARATALLRHPSIVEILDCDVHPSGRAYIVMEFLEGENLGDCLKRTGSFQSRPAMAAAIVGQIASALVSAHAKGIVHRDLKPDNIFLASTPEAETPITLKVLDFGIAKLMGGDGATTARRTRTGSLLGTPLYMSPEQCRGTGRIDHRTDIYSLGCILFELMSGRPPFIYEGAGELFVAHVSEEPPALSSLVPSVAPPLADLVRRMLAKDADQRPQSMAEVVAALEGFLEVRASQFPRLIEVPEGFPVHDQPSPPDVATSHPAYQPEVPISRTRALPETETASQRVSRTAVLPDQGPTSRSSAPTLRAPSSVAPPPAARRGARLGVVVVVLVALVLAAGGAFVALRARKDVQPARPPVTPTDTAPATPGVSPADQRSDLAAIATFLQTGAEPPWPDGCRTSHPDQLHALAAAARSLPPGVAGAERAHGLALLQAVPDSIPERWIVEARVTLTADPAAAAQASARAVSLCASSAVAQNLRGGALQKLQQLDAAAAAYREAALLASGYLAPRFNLGLVQLQQDQAQAALASFDEIARASPDYPNLYLVRAEAHRKLGDQKAAVAILEEQVKRHPDGADGWWQLGRALSSSDRRRAKTAFCRAKALGHPTAVCR